MSRKIFLRGYRASWGIGALLCMVFTGNAKADIYLAFSPYDEVEPIWIEMIDKAQSDIKISAFGFTNKNIGEAVIRAHKRGVGVLICEDKMQSGSKHDLRDVFRAEGIEVIVKKTTALEHNKMIAVDGENAIIGSWNLSGNAAKQDNSVVVFEDEPEFVLEVYEAIQRIYERDK